MRPGPGYSVGPGSHSGNLRSRRAPVGGGSVKPRLRNNGGSPIAGRGAGPSNYTLFGGNQKQRPGYSTGPGSFSGNQKQKKGFDTSFGSFQGNARIRKPAKGGGSVKFRLHNNGGSPLQKQAPGLGTALATRYQGNLRSNRIPKPDRSYEGYQGNMRAKDNPAMNMDYANFQGRYRLSQLVPGYNMSYVNYSGNTKVKRGSKKGKHPSFYYDGIKNSSIKEKDKPVNFKLMWSKLFKKNENRPKHLDEKVNPRYSRDEAKIWYE
jgi:hypothetical protein